MAGVLSGLGSYLFGINPVSDTEAEQAAAAQAKLAGVYQSQQAQAYAQQQHLANNLWGVVCGQGPSVAGTQLQEGLDQSLANGNSMAASGTGVNGALARYAAILSAGNQAAQTNQAGALLRAQEEAQARQQLGGVTGAMAGEAGSLEENSTNNDLQALGLSTSIQEQNQKTTAALDGALLSGAAQIGAAALTGGGSLAATAAAKAAAAAAGGGGSSGASPSGVYAGPDIDSNSGEYSPSSPYAGPDIDPEDGSYTAPPSDSSPYGAGYGSPYDPY